MHQSPFQSILHTNIAPSDADCRRIRELLLTPQQELADLDKEISRVQDQLDALTRRKAALDAYVEAHLAMISQARRLPDDIVREIFANCLPSHRNSIVSSDEAPLLLCQVCRPWREIALTTPRLWSSLHIVLPKKPLIHLQVLTQIVSEWLDRSGVLPLSLSVICSRSWWTGEDNALPILQRLIQSSRRWQRIHFEFANHLTFAALRDLRPDDVPILRDASIHGIERRAGRGWQSTDPDDDPVKSYRFLSFLDASHIQRVSINGAHGMPTSALPLPWVHLTVLDITEGCLSYDEAVTIVRRCPALEKLALSIESLESRSTDHVPPISLHRLRDLSIFCDTDGASTAFIALLLLPSLRAFKYSQRSALDGALPFSPLLAQASHLEHFALSAVQLPPPPLLNRCLAAMPLLQHLELAADLRLLRPPTARDRQDHELVAHLTPRAAAAALCPHLATLTLAGLENISGEALVRLVKARAHAHAPLRRLECVMPDAMQPDVAALLAEEVAGGLVLRLAWKNPPSVPVYSPTEGTERYRW
ncbi:hypothetical protein B0H15DRAFT_408902 [Mycena belliarum]|uniref:F-box domain-containing protein n=1 Tax=Mycena belliarum TaxID=1033014 RepID=A0AAD6XWM4_9AGAR|nr:hypothetical protein B0H15DRAFT_408902 [Mycena belliae]